MKEIHSENPNPTPEYWEALRNTQRELAYSLEIFPEAVSDVSFFSQLLCMDAQYEGEWAWVALVACDLAGNIQHAFLKKTPCLLPYRPGYLTFREGIPLLETVNAYLKHSKTFPHLLVVDGHGTAHPRRVGLAAWLGLKTGIPAMGIAKKNLLPRPVEPASSQGSTAEIWHKDELVGHVLRTRDNVKPLYVSAGHRLSQTQALAIAKSLMGKYRHSEPMRRADGLARSFQRGEVAEGFLALEV